MPQWTCPDCGTSLSSKTEEGMEKTKEAHYMHCPGSGSKIQ